MMPHVRQVVDAFGAKPSGEGWSAPCPVHDDRNPSLSLKVGDEQPDLVLVTCGRGCDLDAILAAVGLARSDLYPVQTRRAPGDLIRTHAYYDADGTPLYRVERRDRNGRRDWKLSHPTADGWKPGRGNAPRVLYNLPLILANPLMAVAICEGERDADTITAEGTFIGTTVQNTWKNTDPSALADRDVFVVIDNDDTGWKRGRQALDAVRAAGARAHDDDCVVRPPDRFKDVTDYLQSPGANLDGLVFGVDLDNDAPPRESWDPPPSPLLDPKLPDGSDRWAKTPAVALLDPNLQDLDIRLLCILDARAGRSGIAKVNVTKLAKTLRRKRQTIATSLNRLETAGYIERSKRGTIHVLNPARSRDSPSLFPQESKQASEWSPERSLTIRETANHHSPNGPRNSHSVPDPRTVPASATRERVATP